MVANSQGLEAVEFGEQKIGARLGRGERLEQRCGLLHIAGTSVPIHQKRRQRELRRNEALSRRQPQPAQARVPFSPPVQH